MNFLAALCIGVFFAVSGCQDRPPKPKTVDVAAGVAASLAGPAHA